MAIRDLANTPLQTIGLTVAVLRRSRIGLGPQLDLNRPLPGPHAGTQLRSRGVRVWGCLVALERIVRLLAFGCRCPPVDGIDPNQLSREDQEKLVLAQASKMAEYHRDAMKGVDPAELKPWLETTTATFTDLYKGLDRTGTHEEGK